MDIKGSIITREGQILAYAEDILIMTRTCKRMVEMFKELEKVARWMRIKVSEKKTK